jgi:hypothetical protein
MDDLTVDVGCNSIAADLNEDCRDLARAAPEIGNQD